MASSAGQLSRWCKFQGQKTSTIHGSAFNSCSDNTSFEWILPNNCFCFSTFKLHEKNSSDDFCSCLTMCLSFYLYLIYEVLVDGSQLTRKVWCSIKEKIMNVIDRFSCLAGHLGLQNQQQSIYLSAPHLGRLACRHADFPGTFLGSSRVLRAVPTHILSSAQGL